MTIQSFTVRELMTMPDPQAGKVLVEDNYIVIRDQCINEIPLDECTTPEQLLECVMHLCEKGSVSPSIIRRVITIACQENNLKIYS